MQLLATETVLKQAEMIAEELAGKRPMTMKRKDFKNFLYWHILCPEDTGYAIKYFCQEFMPIMLFSFSLLDL